MLKYSQLVEIGKFNKPHGILGEIAASILNNVNIERLNCIVLEMDGIYVPFFIDECRPKNHETVLLKIDGINDDAEARNFTNKIIYVVQNDDCIDVDMDDKVYASDFIGFTISDTTGINIGEIIDIEDSTENALFIIETPYESIKYIPIADDLIEEILMDERKIIMSIPNGLLDL